MNVLKNILRAEYPNIVFLMQTRMTSKQMLRINYKLGFDCGVYVDRVGIGGGLALLWKNTVDLAL